MIGWKWPLRDFFGGKSTLYESYISKDAESSHNHSDTYLRVVRSHPQAEIAKKLIYNSNTIPF